MTGSAKRDGSVIQAASKAKPTEPEGSPGLDRVVQAQIGDKLRTMYGELVDQPVPDRLADIIRRLGGER